MKPFNHIYKENYKAVYRLAFRFLKDQNAAADISQDVFMYLYKNLNTNGNIENKKAWLFRVCSNLILAYIRKKQRTIELNADVKIDNLSNNETNSEIENALKNLMNKTEHCSYYIMKDLHTKNYQWLQELSLHRLEKHYRVL